MKPRGRPTTSTSAYSPPVDSAVARNSNRTSRSGTSITSPGFAICYPLYARAMTAYARLAPIWMHCSRLLIFAPAATR